MTSTPVAAAVVLVTVAAAAAGRLPFALVVLALATVALVDFTTVLASAGPRPVVLAAAVPGVVLPAAVHVRPAWGWTTVPDVVAGGVLIAFVAVLVFGRRRDVTVALGATALAGLVIGLGATGLLLLRSLPQGSRWVLGLLVVVAAVQTARRAGATRLPPRAVAAWTVVAALLAGGALVVVVAPPFTFSLASGMAAVALLAVAAAGLLGEAVDDAIASATIDRGNRPPPAGAGVLTVAALPMLLAAPAAYAFARVAAL